MAGQNHRACCCADPEGTCCHYNGSGVATSCEVVTRRSCQHSGGVWRQFGLGTCGVSPLTTVCPTIGTCGACFVSGATAPREPYIAVVGLPDVVLCINPSWTTAKKSLVQCQIDTLLPFLNSAPEGLHVLVQGSPGVDGSGFATCGWSKHYHVYDVCGSHDWSIDVEMVVRRGHGAAYGYGTDGLWHHRYELTKSFGAGGGYVRAYMLGTGWNDNIEYAPYCFRDMTGSWIVQNPTYAATDCASAIAADPTNPYYLGANQFSIQA